MSAQSLVTSTPVSLAFGGAAAPGPGPIVGPDQPPPGDGNPNTLPPGDTGGGFQVSTDGDREPFLDWAQKSPVAWVGGGVFAVGLIGGVVFALSSSASYSNADDVRAKILAEAAKPGQNKTNAPCNPDIDLRLLLERLRDLAGQRGRR
ncbi:MAG: hypothetical protein R3B07_37005 [Polyangiaceae bacterium]